MESKYREYRSNHRMMVKIVGEDGQFQALHDKIKKKDEELKEKYEEIMRAIGQCSMLEETLRSKEDELEVSKRVIAENTDLRAQVASLIVDLEQSEARVVTLGAELSTRVEELNLAERTRMSTVVEATTLEGILRVCRSEQASETETSALKLERLEEPIKGLEAKLYGLNEQVITLKAEKEKQQVQPSTSHTSADPSVSRELYKM
uniref:Myosin-2 heavy chain, non muscle-like n=1 Tax=Nicotiana tabacum TaxID=4097 RepID=A0A1S4C966_TOBAC|nr:PREDICTED: myosin-2 heavy chain, non muscle-like [Nicotiana tabacum]